MQLFEVTAIYYIITNAFHSINERKSTHLFLHKELGKIANSSIIKQAFDTRRINQETEFNPRRGAQYYQRSEPFLRSDTTQKIETFKKLKIAVDEVKETYVGAPEWFDSNCRVLSSTIDRTLRVEQKDLDYSEPHLDYLSELLYLRYRLSMDDLNSMDKDGIKIRVLSKDEKLSNSLYKNSNYSSQNINTNTSSIQTYSQPIVSPASPSSVDQFLAKLLENVKASNESPDVERSIVLTVRDKINDLKKEA